jgi:hypothetical protein
MSETKTITTRKSFAINRRSLDEITLNGRKVLLILCQQEDEKKDDGTDLIITRQASMNFTPIGRLPLCQILKVGKACKYLTQEDVGNFVPACPANTDGDYAAGVGLLKEYPPEARFHIVDERVLETGESCTDQMTFVVEV